MIGSDRIVACWPWFSYGMREDVSAKNVIVTMTIESGGVMPRGVAVKMFVLGAVIGALLATWERVLAADNIVADKGAGNSRERSFLYLDGVLRRRSSRLCMGEFELDREHARAAGAEYLRRARSVSAF